METISHREMRNGSSQVLRAVAAGESYTITNDGVPVARLVPARGPVVDLPGARAASRVGGARQLRRHHIEGTLADTLEHLRDER